ncbi:Cop9 Signalosome Complex Subunit 3, partial [Manis pentadactyla]
HSCCAPLEVRPDFPWGAWEEEEEEAVQSSAQFSVLGSPVQAASMVDGDMFLRNVFGDLGQIFGTNDPVHTRSYLRRESEMGGNT